MTSFLRRIAEVCGIVLLAVTAGRPALAQVDTANIVTAANKFLATLTPDQRQKVSYGFSDNAQRARWSNLPTGFVPRGGINLKQMTPAQRTAAMSLMATVLSPMGLEKVNEIRSRGCFLISSRSGPASSVRPPPRPAWPRSKPT